VIGALTEQLTGMLCMAEDQPRITNGVTSTGTSDGRSAATRDRNRLQRARSSRESSAVVRAKAVLRETGALLFHTHGVKTFPHAAGTCGWGAIRRLAARRELPVPRPR
jgi:hypothetical protein